MYLHFAPLLRNTGRETEPRIFGCQQPLFVGEEDRYDRWNDYSHSIAQCILDVGEYFEDIPPLFKSWEVRTLPYLDQSIFVERLFVKDDTAYIPYRARVRLGDNYSQTYIFYKNLEHIYAISHQLHSSWVACRDPRIDAFAELNSGRYNRHTRDQRVHIEFGEFLEDYPGIAHKIGRRHCDTLAMQGDINNVLDRMDTSSVENCTDFQNYRDMLLPSLQEIPPAYLSDDVSFETAKRIRQRYVVTAFSDEEVAPLNWFALPNVILGTEKRFDRLATLIEDMGITDYNVDIAMIGRQTIADFHVSGALDRYFDMAPRNFSRVTPDMFDHILYEFSCVCYQYFCQETDRDMMLRELLDRKHTIKLIKTSMEEAMILIYPPNAKASADPLFGIYFDLAARALGDPNTCFSYENPR